MGSAGAHETLAAMLLGPSGRPWRVWTCRSVFAPVVPPDALAPGECLIVAVPFDGSRLARAWSCLLLPALLRRVHRAMARLQLEDVTAYGVEPQLSSPVFAFELRSAASVYAEACLRPRSHVAVARRLILRVWGADPLLGGVVIVGHAS